MITDGWGHYLGIERLGYVHDRRVVHGSGKKAHELLPIVHRVIALVKRWLEGTHQGSFKPHHLDYYLDEYAFRFNRKGSKSRGLLSVGSSNRPPRRHPSPTTSSSAPRLASIASARSMERPSSDSSARPAQSSRSPKVGDAARREEQPTRRPDHSQSAHGQGTAWSALTYLESRVRVDLSTTYFDELVIELSV